MQEIGTARKLEFDFKTFSDSKVEIESKGIKTVSQTV